MSIDVPDHDPILLDLGTGVRYFGLDWPDDAPFHGDCLLTHLHWDHVQGLPFFPPLNRADARLDVYAPRQDDGRSICDVVLEFINPPLFPVGVADLPAEVVFRDVGDDRFSLGDVEVTSRLIPHIGPTCGYRVEYDGAALAYVSDHQQPGVGCYDISDAVIELCSDVDVLIHDAQFTDEEFVQKPDWGHCTIDFAIRVALACRVKTLVLYHHDPQHHDDQLDALVAAARAHDARLEVIGAREGLSLHIGP